MLQSSAPVKNKLYDMKKELPDISILHHCRTVVEKKDYVSTGILGRAEGDLLEVEINDFKNFSLGEQIKLTIYSPEGIFFFHSTIVGIDSGSLMIIHPPENKRKFDEKRGFPRVDVSRKKGYVSSILLPNHNNGSSLDAPIPFSIKNISLSGMGIIVFDSVKLMEQSRLELVIELEPFITCTAEIVRREAEGTETFYGVRYVNFPEDKINTLRAFILKTQIETLSIRKRDEEKRMFK